MSNTFPQRNSVRASASPATPARGRRGLFRAAILGVLCVSVVTARAHAGSVELLVNSDEAFVDVPFALAIDVTAEESNEIPQFPELENAIVELAGTNQSSSSFQMTINGRSITRKTTVRYLYRIRPTQVGALRIPAIPVIVDGQKQFTRPMVLRVSKMETDNLLIVELSSETTKGYVGEAIDVTLNIWIAPFTSGSVNFDHNAMWRQIDFDASNWGPFKDAVLRRQPKVTWRQARRKGDDGETRNYFVYEIEATVRPERAGMLPGEEVKVVVEYPLRAERSRSVFSMMDGPRVTQSKTLVGGVTENPVDVLPIPENGRPPYYQGAVGPHEFAVSATPTESKVGDPITLHMDIRGDSDLDRLQAPRLAQMPEITEHFQVANDPLPGVVEGDRKRFTQSVRALSDDVSEIPPIPFSYFDTDRGEFVTVHSDPIPLSIAPAERMSATQIVHSAGSGGGGKLDTLTRLTQGIESNYVDPDALLAQHELRMTNGMVAAAAGCPLIYAACALLQHRRRKYVSDTAWRRRKSARKSAQRTIASAGNDPGRLGDALTNYIADRLDLPAGGLTRQEVLEELRRHDVSAATVAQCDEVLSACESAQFGGGLAVDTRDLSRRVRECVDAVSRDGI